MIWYLDSNVVMYLVENRPLWGPAIAARVSSLRESGDSFAVRDLTRMECRVGPLKSADALLLSYFDAFFASSDVRVVSLNAAVFDRAALIRARQGLKRLDAIHLAAAIEGGCQRFLTNDTRLAGFSDIQVDILA